MGDADLPDEIPFYLRQNCLRLPREREESPGFSQRFPCPYDLLSGRIKTGEGGWLYQGVLHRRDSRWGTFWQADFSGFKECGSYQIETDYQVSPPFMISKTLYDRLALGYLTYLRSQRCGCEIPGVHPECHADDGVLDVSGERWNATGGWHNAGDFRKWLSLTQPNLEALVLCSERGNPGFRAQALEEIRWGNKLFHRMISEKGQVFEDVAGGSAPPGSGFEYPRDWWFENHPGCYGDASDNRWTDNLPGTGDERLVRTTYNPLVQYLFVQTQMRSANVLPTEEAGVCQRLALRGWEYGQKQGHDGSTLFVAQELLAGLELRSQVRSQRLIELTETLLQRQETGDNEVSGFFYERDQTDAFRSIAFSDLPVLALLRLIEIEPPGLESLATNARKAIRRYCEEYLLADSLSNAFALTPYGVYLNPPDPERQTFRDAGAGRGIRTFMHPFNRQGIVHGTSGVLASHAFVLAKAGALLDQRPWGKLAEQQLQWALGHNPSNRSLFTGIGYRQPIGYGFRISQIPEATMTGFIGWPDDRPYLEESFAIEWNTLEYWDIPYAYTIQACSWLH